MLQNEGFPYFLFLIIVTLPPLFFHLVSCGLLLLFEKTVHPWRHLGKERERHCWGKLQGSKKGIQAEPTLWQQVGFLNQQLFFTLYMSLQVGFFNQPLFYTLCMSFSRKNSREGRVAMTRGRVKDLTSTRDRFFLPEFHLCNTFNAFVYFANDLHCFA